MNPTVSIIMATYNRSEYILESIESILKQTYENWECIIVDDGSTDATEEVLAPVLNKDTRFKYYKRTSNYQKGLPGSRNFGLDLAKGDYIIFFDDDDIAHPQNLELCLLEFNKQEISFCRYNREVFKGDFIYDFDFSKEYSSFFIDNRDINKILRNEIQFNSCQVMWTRESFANHRYTEHLKYAEEWEVYARVLSSIGKGISINKTLYYGRKHLNSVTGDFNTKNLDSIKSYTDAIVLVLENLRNKKMLSDEIIRYFVQISLNYKKHKLFKRILKTLDLSKKEKFRWMIYYKILPFRLFFYGLKKKHKAANQK